MCFTNFSNASFHYLRRDDLERKLDHQRTLQRADADDNRKKELLLEWMLDDLLQAEIEPEIESKFYFKYFVCLFLYLLTQFKLHHAKIHSNKIL